MKYLFGGLLAAAMLLTGGCAPSSEQGPTASPSTTFRALPATQTNVTFSNTLSERPTPHRTELLYEYFSNGAGVAVGDVNGDGRPDLYFTGNMSYNALYLNRGNMTFEEVTRRAGVQGRPNTWSTGVTMADVNGDGLLDLYVCYSGELPLERRVDALYVNQGTGDDGVPRFADRAAAFGLAQPHSSNQAYFLDHDRDGDLDLFLQTHNVKSIPRRGRDARQDGQAAEDPVNGNRFYVNNDGTFEDVTRTVGIESPPETYGLGAGVSDVNRDGWPDIYVGNDYAAPDYLYINNGDGTFTDRLSQHMGHTSRSSMGVDVADVNNDGRTDVFVLDMLPDGLTRQHLLYTPNDRSILHADVSPSRAYQFTQNTLQLNNGNGTFSEIGHLAGVAATDWSWAGLAADFDNDGWKDLYVTNGILHDITDRDFLRFKSAYTAQQNYDLTAEDVAQMMRRMPSTDLRNYLFRNTGGLTFDDVSAAWNLDAPTNSTGAAYADLDGDGDLDVVTSNINDEASIYANTTSNTTNRNYLKVSLDGAPPNTHGIGAKLTAYTGQGQQFVEQYLSRGYLSSVAPVLHVGLGETARIDSLRVEWPDGAVQVLRGVEANQHLTLRQREATPAKPARQGATARRAAPRFEPAPAPVPFRHRMEDGVDDFRRQPLMVTPKSFDGPTLARADVNGDGRPDVFAGGGPSQASALYLRQADGAWRATNQPAFAADRRHDDVDAAFFDYDGDGDLDLYVASGGYSYFQAQDPALQDRLYLNDGNGTFARASDALPPMPTSTGAVAATDINGDGQTDLFVGGRVVPGRYPEAPRSYVLIREGNRFVDRTEAVAPALRAIGMVTDAVWHDLDRDGAEELVVAGEWMPITVFEHENGGLVDRSGAYFDRALRGLWNTVAVGDVTGDGRPDLWAGNLGLNAQLQAGPTRPVRLYYGDFDRNGSMEPLLTVFEGEVERPVVMLDRLRSESLMIGSRFASYEAYARASLEEVLTDEEVQAAQRLAVDHLETTLFVQGEDGTFVPRRLPVEAQIAPVFTITPLDYNSDGIQDVVLAGNMNEARVRFGKFDANYGVLLEGQGAGAFRYVPQHQSGLALRGDVRSAIKLGEQILFGTNRDTLQAFDGQRGE